MKGLIDDLLAEQRELTAVAQFARAHEADQLGEVAEYRELLPLSAPRPGEQYAFEVDLDKCSGCKACVTACHSLNGLDDGESWRDVGALFGEIIMPDPCGGKRVEPVQQVVTTACHHCVEPGCLEGCPVLAYDKDPLTGIVRHLDDQCIGCSYCILTCPYDVPKYSAKRGIVRKCDLCHGRLSAGEAPACVQACPSEAIRITLVEKEAIRTGFRSTQRTARNENSGATSDVLSWLPDSPSPAHTLPTTRYLTKKGAPGLRSANHAHPRPESPHWPLILMLVMTQAGIGALAAATLRSTMVSGLGVVSLSWLFGGLVASVFHLGRPAKAWRIWLGWRTSWLSREAIVLGTFAGMAALVVLVPGISTTWGWIVVGVGGMTLACQAMVYADTGREYWKFSRTGPRFLGTAVVLGLAFALLWEPVAGIAAALLLALCLKLGFELSVLKHGDTADDTWTQLRRTAALQSGQMRPILAARLIFGMGAMVALFLVMAWDASRLCAGTVFVLCVLGEFAERLLFFTTVAPDRMP